MDLTAHLVDVFGPGAFSGNPWLSSRARTTSTPTRCSGSRGGSPSPRPRSYSRPRTPTPTTGCESSPWNERCHSLDTPPWAPATPGSSQGEHLGTTPRSCRNAAHARCAYAPTTRRAPRHRSTSGRGRPLDPQRPGLARHTPGLGGRRLIAQPPTELAPPDRRRGVRPARSRRWRRH